MEELQTQFIKSKGKPIIINGLSVTQMDIIPLKEGKITINFLSKPKQYLCGVAIKANKGYIELSDGRQEKLVYIWNAEKLSNIIKHKVYCLDNQLKIWNIYQVFESSLRNADYWTNNAGMVIEQIGENKRKYYCSDGIGDFNKTDLIFTFEWNEDI